jgi:hypothetical protein
MSADCRPQRLKNPGQRKVSKLLLCGSGKGELLS